MIILALAFCIPLGSHGINAVADNSTPHVLATGDVWLYDDKGEKLFIVPASYYARINNLDDNFYYITFNGIAGKVHKKEVSAVGYHTTAPGTSITLYLSESYSDFTHIQLKQHPDIGAESLLGVPYGEGFSYLGSYPTDSGELWYCVKYNEVIGYIRAMRTSEPSITIPTFVPEEPPATEASAEPSKDSKDVINNLTSTELKIIIILGLAIPALAIVVLIFKPHKRKYEE